MRTQDRLTVIVVVIFAFILPFFTFTLDTKAQPKNESMVLAGTPSLWQDPGDITSLDLYHGRGESAAGPKGPFKFIKEDLSGSSPKFMVVDARGVKWKVKIGTEARAETAAVRLVSAVGYFTDRTYFLSVMIVEGLKLQRGRELISLKDHVYNARVEPAEKRSLGHWSWFKNPFTGTKELNGLKVIMALLNNWDIKPANNRIDYNPETRQFCYLVTDLGATFGRTGGLGTRTKAEPKHFAKSKFIKHYNLNQIDFVMSNEHTPMLYIIYPFAYPFINGVEKRKRIVENIPIEDARWVTQLLVQLSNDQIADIFLGAGFKRADVDIYVKTMRKRIDLLSKITGLKSR